MLNDNQVIDVRHEGEAGRGRWLLCMGWIEEDCVSGARPLHSAAPYPVAPALYGATHHLIESPHALS